MTTEAPTRSETSRIRQLIADERLLAVSAILIVAVLLIGGIFWADRAIRKWHDRDLSRRADLIAAAIDPEIDRLDPNEMRRRLNLLSVDERLVGVLICSRGGEIVNVRLKPILSCASPLVPRARDRSGSPLFISLNGHALLLNGYRVGAGSAGTVVVVQDRGFIWSRRQILIRVAALAGMLAFAVLILAVYQGARLTRRRADASMIDSLHRAASGEDAVVPDNVAGLLDRLNRDLARVRSERGEPLAHGPARLRGLINERMPDTPLVVVANREPYSHVRDGNRVLIERPASGLVAGVEPLLKACGGVWVGHGSGNADRENSDAHGRVAVPPDHPEYVLRRVWLTQREEQGYYLGFANEGLWPLCHIAHTRPTFRADDWIQYQRVNEKFADAAAEEAGDHGLVLVQDYHFGLLPLELRKRAPGTVISLFWHIPWPNQEVVGICPWTTELLTGMLGADIIGFHTRYHCLNFLETVGRYLECRVALETMSVEHQGHETKVRPYPISVPWPYPAVDRGDGRKLRQELGIAVDASVAVGVDRADYTKGILERLAAVEELLVDHPELVGRFVFVQIAAPSRSSIKRYRDFVSEVEEAAARINRRFGSESYQPVILQVRHHQPEEVLRYFAMADLALITPLHDGMNLVAKEYVASCSDEQGALVLSIFAGASKELEAALLVNPYDASDVARAIHEAITMPVEERKARMQAMRAAVEKNTIYDWSASLLGDLAEIWEQRNAVWRRNDRRALEEAR